MKRFRIPAVDLIGRPIIENEMRSRGYENVRRTLSSWVQRRKVPEAAKIMLLELAQVRDVTVDLDDFVIEPVSARSNDMAA